MSIQALNYAFELPLERATDKVLLLCLANFANEDGYAWPSQVKLLCQTSLDRETIIRGLQRLCDIGVIERTEERVGRTRSIPVYRLIHFIDGGDPDRLRASRQVLRERCSSTADYNQKLRDDRQGVGNRSRQQESACSAPRSRHLPTQNHHRNPQVRTTPPSLRSGGGAGYADARAPVVGLTDHQAGSGRAAGDDHRPATAHIPAQSAPHGVEGTRQGGRTGKPPEAASGPPKGAGGGQAPSLTPQAMLEVWNAVMAGCRIPAAQMTGRRAGQLARVARHPLIAGRLDWWQGYCQDLRADAWNRGAFDGRPITIERAATVERLEETHATDMAARAERDLDRYGIPPDLPVEDEPVVAQEDIPQPRRREVPPELAAIMREGLGDAIDRGSQPGGR